MNIGFIGNFTVPYTTENERKWAFEKLGHKVIPFQENETSPFDICNSAIIAELDMLIYSHTHGWEIPNLIDIFGDYKENEVPTVSIHLDRWAGLAREVDMGKEATWYTQYLFMADASPEAQELYKDLNLNWYWLKPGVSEKDCYIAPPDHTKFPHEIIFVGSRGYHSEYPWRPKLVDWLKETYGSRFGHYGNDGIRVVRQDELNVLYASAKIVVGDSCFAGQTKDYWSDRIPETTGRGGFLIHPEVEGLDHKGIITYPAEDFEALKDVIDYYAGYQAEGINATYEEGNLYLAAHKEREKLRREGFEWTKAHRTYTHLSQEMLDVIWK
jgi:hypothetical protein